MARPPSAPGREASGRLALGDRSFVLDADTVINLVNPKGRPRRQACFDGFVDLRARGGRFYVPAFAWHEVLRGALAERARGDDRELRALRLLRASDRVTVLALREDALETAARVWAEAVTSGRAVDDKRVSGDTLVVAEALRLGRRHEGAVIVSDNARHLRPLSSIPSLPFDEVDA
ncbi:MAG: PIN domain-containing protein [Bacteroidota bacterium]